MVDDVKEWASSMRECEEEMVKEITKSVSKVVEDLLPRSRAKAVEESYLTSMVVKIEMDLTKKRPAVSVTGFVPPTIVECREY
jgi:hypothetical protein